MIKRLAVILTACAIVLGIALPAQAAKPVSGPADIGMTTTLVESVADGSEWVVIQADRIGQAGTAVWYVAWYKADGTFCNRTTGNKGTQTGTTWGPTDFTFAYYEGGALQLGVAVEDAVDVTPLDFVRDCEYGVLWTTGPNNKGVVLDAYVPLDKVA
jgi:hypothetical protein